MSLFLYPRICILILAELSFDWYCIVYILCAAAVLTHHIIQKMAACSRLIRIRDFIYPHIDGILPKGPYPPCLRMADRALLAGYPRYRVFHNPSKPNKQVCSPITGRYTSSVSSVLLYMLYMSLLAASETEWCDSGTYHILSNYSIGFDPSVLCWQHSPGDWLLKS